MKNHPYRISEAAIGRFYAEIIELVRIGEIMPQQFNDTLLAIFDYIESGIEPAPEAQLNPMVWERLKTKIDKSAGRSAAARARAAKRREEKARSIVSAAYKSASEYIAEITDALCAANSNSVITNATSANKSFYSTDSATNHIPEPIPDPGQYPPRKTIYI